MLNGTASVIDPEAGDAVPLVQLTLTLTLAALSGTKSLCTTKALLLSVLVIVQLGVPPLVIATFAQADWLAV